MRKLKHNLNGFSAVELLFILLILIVIGLVAWSILKNKSDVDHKSSVTTSNSSEKSANSSLPPPTYTDAYSYLTYRSTTSPSTFYLSSSTGSVIAKTSIPASDDYSYVYARNDQGLIVENDHQTNAYTAHTNPNYILVNFNGSVSTLSSPISTILASALNNSVMYGINTVIYTTCSTTSNTCGLSAINLSSGATTTYLTDPAIQTATGLRSPFSILGASDSTVYYTYNSVFSGPYILNTYNVDTRKITNSYNLKVNVPDPPDLSSDYRYAVYSDQSNTNYVISLSTGDIIRTFSSSDLGGIAASYQNEFLWSPNDQYIEFTSPGVAPSSSTPSMTINTFNIQTGTINTVKSFGDPRHNNATALMWLSPTELYYSLDTTNYANDFGPPYDSGDVYHGLNIQSGDTITNPILSGYSFITNEPDL